jgi:hypothetical protein
LKEGRPDEVTYHARRSESLLELIAAGAMLGGTLWYAWRNKDKGPVKTVEITQPDGSVINIPLLPEGPTPMEEYHGTADEPGPGNPDVKVRTAIERGYVEADYQAKADAMVAAYEEPKRVEYYQATRAATIEERTKGAITITTTTTPIASTIKLPPTLQPSVSAAQTDYTTGAVSSAEARNAQRDRG